MKEEERINYLNMQNTPIKNITMNHSVLKKHIPLHLIPTLAIQNIPIYSHQPAMLGFHWPIIHITYAVNLLKLYMLP